MRLIIYVDEQGLIKVDLIAFSARYEEAHRFFHALQPAIEKLGVTAYEAGREIESGEADSQITYGDVGVKS